MTCHPLAIDGKIVGVVCGVRERRKRCSIDGCTEWGPKLCDFPLEGKRKGATCSRRLCGKHAQTTAAGDDTHDLCPAHATKTVRLVVSTGGYRFAGPDRFDVTRKTGGPAGAPFAPSWGLLNWGLAERDAGRGEEAWPVYRERYREEMRASYVRRRSAWDALLARETATLVCFCPSPVGCHRSALADFLVKLGAKEGTRG
jgi:hypothetical protein